MLFTRLLPVRFLAALCCALAFSQAHATSVLPLYLDEVIDTASVAFEGKCIANRTEREAGTNLVVTYTTFEVRDVLKGAVGKTHEIKQIGGAAGEGNLDFRVKGVPSFTVGEDYVVFLAGVSSAGFSSPIGLGQGKFGIESKAGGRRVANGRDFQDMTARMTVDRVKRASGPVRDMDLDEFKQTVRNHLGRAR
jgi:hypothetical protein